MATAQSTADKFDIGVMQISKEQSAVGVICLVVLAVRLGLINLNQGEYTDGILQITRFTQPGLSNGNFLWPPLYGLLTYTLALFRLDLETAAKLISILSSVLVLAPIYMIGRMLNGRLCAIFAIHPGPAGRRP